MLLTELVESIVEYLNTNRALWTDDDTLTVKAELDAIPGDTEELIVFVTPQSIQPLIESTKTRGRRSSTQELLVCSLILAKQFVEVPTETTQGIANWTTEVLPLINTWQRAQEVLLRYETPTLTLTGVEPSPPEPIQQDMRIYAVMTTYSFEQSQCDTAHELPSSLTVSNAAITLQGIRDSMKSRR